MSRPIDQEFAVVVAALLAGRIDGQQAIASLTATHTAHLAAILADPETVEAVAEAVENPRAWSPRGSWLHDDLHHWQARAAITVIAARMGCEVLA